MPHTECMPRQMARTGRASQLKQSALGRRSQLVGGRSDVLGGPVGTSGRQWEPVGGRGGIII